MTTTIRATQQKKVYAAESAVDHGRRFTSLDEIQEFVDDLRDADYWWERLAPKIYRVEVAPGATHTGNSMATWYEEAGAGLIEMQVCHWTEHDVLHEVAHCVANSNVPKSGHDPFWVRTFLTLTYHVRGPEAYVALRQAFLDHDVVIDTGA
jgi:putative metallohydrolase (TIGR04338 family)